jgi:hypothetical protein
MDYSATLVIPPAPAIPIAPPQVEVLGDVTPDDAELDDMLNGAPDEPIESIVPVDLSGQPPPFNLAINVTLPDEAEPDPVPVAFDVTPKREPRNALERDLFARLEAMRSKANGGAANA